MSERKAVFGICPNAFAAESAVTALKDAGYQPTDISMLCQRGPSTDRLAHEKNTKAPEGALIGGGTGVLLGGALGWLAGLGALAIPGVGPFVAAGPIMATLAGAGMGGTAGGLTGALIGAAVPEYEAKLYEGHLKRGGILLSVRCSTHHEANHAVEILRNTGAQDIAVSHEVCGDVASASGRLHGAS